jgi:hypothetical protein
MRRPPARQRTSVCGATRRVSRHRALGVAHQPASGGHRGLVGLRAGPRLPDAQGGGAGRRASADSVRGGASAFSIQQSTNPRALPAPSARGAAGWMHADHRHRRRLSRPVVPGGRELRLALGRTGALLLRRNNDLALDDVALRAGEQARR